MSESKEETTGTDKKATLSLRRPGKLEIKKTVEGGQVRQSFSHGRSKVVAVEVQVLPVLILECLAILLLLIQ